MKKGLKKGLCEGRHPIPGVTEYIFGNQLNPLDLAGMDATCQAVLEGCTRLDLYVTGLTVALVAVINYCHQNKVALTLWHFNRESGDYYPQPVF
jgi:hypothetical protein